MFKIISNYKSVILGFLFSLFLLIGVVRYVEAERFIYFGDYANYFNKYKSLNIANDFKNGLPDLKYSVHEETYNNLVVIPLTFVRNFLGTSRLGYILSVTFLYSLPSLLLMSKVLKTVSTESKKANLFLSMLAVIFATPPAFYGPTLRGYVDVVIVIPIALLFIYSWKLLNKNFVFKDGLYIGLLMLTIPLLRRYGLIWVACFVVALMLTVFLKYLHYKISNPAFLKLSVAIYISIFVFIALSYLIKPEYINFTNANYLPGLFAYHSTFTFIERLLSPIAAVGLGYFLLMVVGVFLTKGEDEKYYTYFQLFVLFLSTILFLNIQDINHHHLYLFLPSIIYFISRVNLKILRIRNVNLKASLLFGLTLYMVFSYKVVFIDRLNFSPLFSLLPNIEYPPPIRNDIAVIDNIIYFLDDNTGGEKIYVVSSSYTFNHDIVLERARVLGADNVIRNLLKTFDVDKRDGYPYQFHKAKFVVVTNPVGYHLEPNEQKVIGKVHEYVVTGQDYIKVTDCYLIENNICVEIYKKVKESGMLVEIDL